VDAKTREQLKAKYPDRNLEVVSSEEDGIEIVVGGAPPAVWTKYQGLIGDLADAGKRTLAHEILVRGSMVHPENQEAFHAELERRHLTGFYSVAAQTVRKLTGAREDMRVSKL
jgi:hypothetical protein